MGRKDYQHVLLKLNKGINQQADLAEPDQCADARNVWAPNGKVERRPGYLSARAAIDLGDGVSSNDCLLYASPRPRDQRGARMTSDA